jgi:hypothetical protein
MGLIAAITVAAVSLNTTNNITKTIETNNGLGDIPNPLKILGISGITTFFDGISVKINNLRDLTPYTVGPEGEYQYATPQEAYNAAIADGRGDDFPAVIIISPGTYSFGNNQFPIIQTGISWVALPAVPGVSGGVIFTATGSNGGIHVETTFDAFRIMIFQGITFGGVNDATGFLLNVTGGQIALSQCGSLNSNFRIVLGSDLSFVVFAAFQSTFKTLPPNDFITTISEFVQIIIESCNIIQVYTGGDPVPTQGGHVFNLQNGVGQVTLLNSLILLNYYDGFINGPNTTNGAFISMYGSRAIFFESFYPYFMKINGKCSLEISRNNMNIQGPLIYIPQDLISGNGVSIIISTNDIASKNTTIKTDSTVTTIGNIDIKILNSRLVVGSDDYIIDIPNANIGDTLNVLLTQSTITTQSTFPPNYANGPGFGTATITVGGSYSTNSATTANGFTYIPLTPL